MRLEVAEYIDELTRRQARDRLLAFTEHCFNGDYDVAWHNILICEELDNWIEGRSHPNLILMVPPRYGKSELVSRMLPAYIFGRFPDSQIIAVSYSQDLMMRMSRDSQRIITSEPYQKIFPKTKLAASAGTKRIGGVIISQTGAQYEIVGYKGRYMAAGVGTGITGHGADYGILDDVTKDRQAAESPTVRDNVWEWYTSTFRTRLEKGAKQVLLMTRWHQEDLAGRLIKRMESDPEADQWNIIALPALFEASKYNHPKDNRKPGEALWPRKYDEKALRNAKASIGSYDFQSLYQQNPSPPEGAIAKREWFKFVDKPPEGLQWVRFWDLAVSGNAEADYTASIKMAVDRFGQYYIDQPIRGKWVWPTAKKILIDTCLSESEVEYGIETGGPQKGLADDLLYEEALSDVNIRGFVPVGNKLCRALIWFARLEAGRISLVRGAWNEEYIDEVCRFKGVDGDRDDQVDATSGGWKMLSDRWGGMEFVETDEEDKPPLTDEEQKVTDVKDAEEREAKQAKDEADFEAAAIVDDELFT